MSTLLKYRMGLMLVGITIFFLACTTEPKVTEFSGTTNPQVELDRLNENLGLAVGSQVEILSPTNFTEAVRSRDRAIQKRSKNENQTKILHDIALAQAYLAKAEEVSAVGRQLLGKAIVARKDAVTADANRFFAAEFSKIDSELIEVTENVEKNDTSDAQKKSESFENQFRQIELKAIKHSRLGSAEAVMIEAKKEGAKTLTPETLTWAEARMVDDNKVIEADRHNIESVNRASEDAKSSSARLLAMVRSAKNSKSMKPEDFAKQNESLNLDKANAETALSSSESRLAKSSERNGILESQVWLDKKYDSARKKFSKEEAEVYKQGSNLLIRLKGLAFEQNRSTLSTQSFPLMAKVQMVVGEIVPTHISIEGHTDSIGSQKLNQELSLARAEAVRSYLVSNNNIDENKIVASGLGYSKPLATNKTTLGRSQNRRVDIIISREPEQM